MNLNSLTMRRHFAVFQRFILSLITHKRPMARVLVMFALVSLSFSQNNAQATGDADDNDSFNYDVRRGNVRARIVYDKNIAEDERTSDNLMVEVSRANRIVFRGDLSLEDNSIMSIEAVEVLDLDADREPEIVIQIISSGAYCCSHSIIYRYEPARRTYTRRQFDWSNYRNLAQMKDVSGDGVPELVSTNEFYSGAFCPYVCSGAAPLQIWQYRRGRIVDITRRVPRLVRQDAANWWKEINNPKSDWHNHPTAVAAFIADKHLLNEAADGWRMARRVPVVVGNPGYYMERRDFDRLVRKTLRTYGYMR